MSKKEVPIVLFSSTLCWASSYIFIRNPPPELSGYAYVAPATGLAALLPGAVCWRRSGGSPMSPPPPPAVARPPLPASPASVEGLAV